MGLSCAQRSFTAAIRATPRDREDLFSVGSLKTNSACSHTPTFAFNLMSDEGAKRLVLSIVDFRKARSVAINHEEMNEADPGGLGREGL